MNKTKLARVTQVCMAHRMLLNAHSIKGLAYLKRPNDSQVSTNNKMGLWNVFTLQWFVASEEPQHTHKAHKERPQPQPEVYVSGKNLKIIILNHLYLMEQKSFKNTLNIPSQERQQINAFYVNVNWKLPEYWSKKQRTSLPWCVPQREKHTWS